VKNLVARDLGLVGLALKRGFDLLNVHRFQSGIENYGYVKKKKKEKVVKEGKIKRNEWIDIIKFAQKLIYSQKKVLENYISLFILYFILIYFILI